MSFALALQPPAFSLKNPTYESNFAVGRSSLQILDLISQVVQDDGRSILLGWRSHVRSQISDLVAHYSSAGWDGEDALPVSVESASVASVLIDALPDNVIAPEVTPEIDGRISLDWNLGKNRILSVSISSEMLIYAAIVGNRKIHGETTSVYELPQEIKDLLPGYFSRAT